MTSSRRTSDRDAERPSGSVTSATIAFRSARSFTFAHRSTLSRAAKAVRTSSSIPGQRAAMSEVVLTSSDAQEGAAARAIDACDKTATVTIAEANAARRFDFCMAIKKQPPPRCWES